MGRMFRKLSFLPKTVSFVSVSISIGILSIIINAILLPIVWSEISSVWKEFDMEIQEFKDLENLVQLELARFPVEVKRKTREDAQEFLLNEEPQPNRKHQRIIKRIVHRTNKLKEEQDVEDYGPIDEPDLRTFDKCECNHIDCPVGQKGAAGVPGKPGSQGVPGPDGQPGISAATLELVSSQRTNCVLCPAGPPGNKGNRGITGWRGLAGYRGVAGIPGRHGFHGKPGEAGDAGREGEIGKPGEKGNHGMDVYAVVGLPGKKGTPGSAGSAGEAGNRGFDSNTFGSSGLRGSIGVPGIAGRPGAVGPHGAPGPKGKRGERFCECGLVQKLARARTVGPPSTSTEEREIRKSPVHKNINITESPLGYSQSGLVHINNAMAEKKKANELKIQEIIENDDKISRIVDEKMAVVKVQEELLQPSHYYELAPPNPPNPPAALPKSSYSPIEEAKLKKKTKKKSKGRKHGSATVRAPPIKIHSRRRVHHIRPPNHAESLIDLETKRVTADENKDPTTTEKPQHSSPPDNRPLLEKIAEILAASRAPSHVPVERPIRRSPISTGPSTIPSVNWHKEIGASSMNSRREPLSYANIKLQHNIPPRVLQRHLEHMRNKFSIGMIDNSI